MTYLDNQHHQPRIDQLADDAVVANAVPPIAGAVANQTLAELPWVVAGRNAVLEITGNLARGIGADLLELLARPR